ncbi:permease [Clostridium zeae]|uniref:Permease n=1 Tax=Clostridium zeae TaxID=2759022 RepID=A0ABQ1EEA0_9CLOT|nr:ABC transporter permease [Clostridium zeae]GFZ33084.1 permease [Clostridium zeae]
MNKLLHLLFIDLKLLSKTKVFYLKLILFPCVLILILGYMFGNSNSKLSTFEVAYYSEDEAVSQNSIALSLGETLKSDVLDSKALKELFSLKTVTSYSEGENLIKNKKAAAFIYVPKNFTKAYLDNTKTDIILLADNTKQIDKGIVKNILDRFNQNIETIRIEENEVEKNLPSTSKMSPMELQNLISKIQSTDSYSDDITKISTNKNTKPIDVMQYESIAMVVMFSILTAFELAHNIVDDKLKNTQFRIKSTPTQDIQYALGKILGIVLAVTVQMSIVMLISHFVFRVTFGNPLHILLITVAYGFTIGTIVFCAGIAAKDQMSISSFASVILYGFSFLGGSFISADSLPSNFQSLQKLIPNGKAINCYLKICEGQGISDIYLDLIALIGIGIIFLLISLVLYRERRRINNANLNVNKKSIKAAV